MFRTIGDEIVTYATIAVMALRIWALFKKGGANNAFRYMRSCHGAIFPATAQWTIVVILCTMLAQLGITVVSPILSSSNRPCVLNWEKVGCPGHLLNYTPSRLAGHRILAPQALMLYFKVTGVLLLPKITEQAVSCCLRCRICIVKPPQRWHWVMLAYSSWVISCGNVHKLFLPINATCRRCDSAIQLPADLQILYKTQVDFRAYFDHGPRR